VTAFFLHRNKIPELKKPQKRCKWSVLLYFFTQPLTVAWLMPITIATWVTFFPCSVTNLIISSFVAELQNKYKNKIKRQVDHFIQANSLPFCHVLVSLQNSTKWTNRSNIFFINSFMLTTLTGRCNNFLFKLVNSITPSNNLIYTIIGL